MGKVISSITRATAIVLLLTACNPKIIGYLDDRADFKNYKTYLMLSFNRPQEKMSAEGNEVLDRLEAFIREEMDRRGYTEVNRNPDLLLRYDLIANSRVETSVNPYGMTLYPTINMRTIQESALLIELKKEKNRKLIWQASIDMSDHTRKTKRKDHLQNSIYWIFTSYPYRAGQSKPDPTLEE